MSNGEIEAQVIERLKEIGDWTKKYGNAIYGTHGGPYEPNKIFTSTREGNEINILLLKRPGDTLNLAPVPNRKVVSVRFMQGSSLKFTANKDNISIQLPEKLPDENCSVIVMEMDGNTADIPVISKMEGTAEQR